MDKNGPWRETKKVSSHGSSTIHVKKKHLFVQPNLEAHVQNQKNEIYICAKENHGTKKRKKSWGEGIFFLILLTPAALGNRKSFEDKQCNIEAYLWNC